MSVASASDVNTKDPADTSIFCWEVGHRCDQGPDLKNPSRNDVGGDTAILSNTCDYTPSVSNDNCISGGILISVSVLDK